MLLDHRRPLTFENTLMFGICGLWVEVNGKFSTLRNLEQISLSHHCAYILSAAQKSFGFGGLVRTYFPLFTRKMYFDDTLTSVQLRFSKRADFSWDGQCAEYSKNISQVLGSNF